MILNVPEMKNKQFLVKTINNQSIEINDLKVQLQDKLHVINDLKHLLAQKSQKTQSELPVVDSRIQKMEDENVSLAFQVSSLVKEREHIKLEYKKLYDSIKQTRAKTKLQTDSLQQKLNDQIYENNKLRAQLKGKFSESQMNHNVLAPSLLKIESEPINAYFKNNRVVHRDYLKVTKEHVATLQELLEEARALKPLDEHIGHASKFDERIQELLVYVSASCPFTQSGNEKWTPTTSHRKNNKPYVDASRTKQIIMTITKEHAVMQNTRMTDNTMLPSIGRVSSTNASRSKPKINTKNDKIPKTVPPSSFNDTSAIVVPPGHIFTITVILVDVSCPKLSLRYANAQGSLSKCMLNTECHPFNLHDFGFERIIRDEELPPWKDLQIGNILISRVYYVEGLGHNLFSVGQFCDSDLKVSFRKHTCFVRNLEGVDLLSGSHGSNLYTISMADMMKFSPICLLSKASKTKSWLWHPCLSYLNFGTINQLAKQGLVKGLPKMKFTKDHLCSACQMGKSKKESHPYKPEPSTNEKLQMLHMDICGPMRVESINGKKYILFIVDDYSLFIWVKFLRTKDEAPEIIIRFLKQVQVSLNATVRYLCTDNGTEFLNQTLRNYTEDVGITHHTSTTRTLQQNSVVDRRKQMLVEATRTMLIFSKSQLFLWAEAVASACYTQNHSFIYTRYNKTPYELLRDRKPELKYLHVFGALCYRTNDFEDLGKLQPKADIGIFIGYSPSKKASGLVLNQAASTSAKPPTKNDWDFLFQLMFNEYFKNPSAVSTRISATTLPPPDIARASSSFSTYIDKDAPSPSTSPNNETTSSPINSTNVETNEEVAMFDSDTFTNPFSPPETSSAESSSRIVDTSNMHTFQKPLIYIKRWTKDHLFTTIISDPSKLVSTRRQLSTDAL
ncbi:retrovirus-related pol polyprotein from transposon TNT 1-94 [Tanacetum coccineum]